MNRNNENTNAFLIHISAFSGYIIPFGSIIVPLVLWQTMKVRSRFLDEQGKEAVNFNISYALYIFILGISIVPFAFSTIINQIRHNNDFHFDFDFGNGGLFGFFGVGALITLIGLLKIALIIIAALKSKEGEHYKYPFTIKFIK